MKKFILMLLTICSLLSYSVCNAQGNYSCEVEWIIEPSLDYTSMIPYSEEFYWVFSDEGTGIIDANNNVILNAEYQDIIIHEGKVFEAGYGEYEYGLFDMSGTMIVPCEHPYRSFSVYDDFIVIFNVEKIVEKKYEGTNVTYKEAEGKWGAIDYSGNVIIPFEYDELHGYGSDDALYAKKNNQSGIIDLNGNAIVPFGEYDDIYNYFEETLIPDTLCGVCILKKDGKYGLVYNDKILIPAVYDYIEYFNDYAVVTQNGEKKIIDYLGNEYNIDDPKIKELEPKYYGYDPSFDLVSFEIEEKKALRMNLEIF